MIKICDKCKAKHHDYIPASCCRCGNEFEDHIPEVTMLKEKFLDYIDREQWLSIDSYFGLETPLPVEVMDMLADYKEHLPHYPKKSKKNKELVLTTEEIPDKINTSKEVLITLTPKQKELAIEAGGIIKGRRLRANYLPENFLEKLGEDSAPARKLAAEVQENMSLVRKLKLKLNKET